MTDLSETAARALKAWGGKGTPRLINQRENAVFEVCLNDARAALRLHRPGYKTRDEIWSELVWTEALADVAFPAPRPIATPSGEMVVALGDGLHATLIEWVAGTPIGSGETPLFGTTAEQSGLFQRIGSLLADLHNVTDGLTLPKGFTRPSWGIDGLTGPDPLWGRSWEHKSLTEDESRLLLKARDAARETLLAYAPGSDIGLIHADALRENIFASGTRLTLIDFDDAGVGDRLYDLATALSQSLNEPALPDLRRALVKGYRARRPLSDEADRLLPMFSMLRATSSLAWTIPRLPADHPKMPLYKSRALDLSMAFLKSSDPLA